MAKNLFIGERSELEEKAGKYLAEIVEKNTSTKLGGATGRTPKRVYEIALNTGTDFSSACIYFLDEYFGFVGLDEDGRHTSYRGYAINHLNAKPRQENIPANKVFQIENIHTPRGNFYEKDQLVTSKRLDEILSENPNDFQWSGMSSEDLDEDDLIGKYNIKTPLKTQKNQNGKYTRTFFPEIYIGPNAKNPILSEIREVNSAYERKVTETKVILQILGLGTEAHIAFNEKGTLPDSITHLLTLAFSTLKANEDDYRGDVSWYAISQGIKTVMNAEELMLLAFGKTKAEAVYDMLFQEPQPSYPASYIQKHENVRLYLDREALMKCEEVCRNKSLKLEQELERKGF